MAPRHSNIPVHQSAPYETVLRIRACGAMKSSLKLTDSDSLGTSCVPHPPGNLRLCKSAILPICLPQTVSLAIACRDAGMPLLSGTDNGQWLDPAGLFRLDFIGLEGILASF
jgi:hypothetical protein